MTMTPTPAASKNEKAREIVERHRKRLADPDNYSILARSEHEYLIDQLAALSTEGEAEPVAWRVRPLGDRVWHLSFDPPRLGYEGSPLYASPAAPAAAGVNAWQDISTAPKKHGARVLLALPGGRVLEGYWGTGRYDRSAKVYRTEWVCRPGVEINPDHWMPMPPAPDAKGER